jgi:hypothetical protein
MSHQKKKRLARSKESHNTKQVQRRNSENMRVLKRFQKSARLMVSYPSILANDDCLLRDLAMPVNVQIVGTLKVDKEQGMGVIRAAGSFIQFPITPDLKFDYSESQRNTILVDLLDIQPYIGQNLHIVGKNFSIGIFEIVDKGKVRRGTTLIRR